MSDQRNRLGQAVVSFIFSFLSVIPLILFFITLDGATSRLYVYPDYDPYEAVAGVVIVELVLFLFFNLLSIILGVRARKSTSGRGLAIAGLTISIIILAVPLIFAVLSILMMSQM